MTAVTARVAGVREVIVASPRPTPITLAAAHEAGADALLVVGGAQAIAALAFGAGPVPAVDVIVGPGNRFVTAAKQLVAGRVGIDMLAGPSELVVLADDTADPGTVAADLLGQAEHDPDARPLLVTWSRALIEAVRAALADQLATLPTAGTARAALARGGAVLCQDAAEALTVCDRLAPEHLEVLTATPEAHARALRHYGGLFIGTSAAEVLGDYGVGPNHVLPTGRTARFTGGLSVADFLRVRTWLRLEPGAALDAVVDDAVALARLEGLEGHARSALRRRP
jgi:phosphoribosyl-ATP pyrophosphohydrolase/phosphoribosyl-AMP cyclohydrolase/histidinol dehydrogenase